MMATFYANPEEENELWIETAIQGSRFRIWHYIFFCFSAFTIIVVLVCCCVKIRVPRTKQEIEADYCRKKLAEKFRVRLKLVQNQDMDALDLERGEDQAQNARLTLYIIQEDYINGSRNCRLDPSPPTVFNAISDNTARPQQPSKNSPQTAAIAKLTLQK